MRCGRQCAEGSGRAERKVVVINEEAKAKARAIEGWGTMGGGRKGGREAQSIVGEKKAAQAGKQAPSTRAFTFSSSKDRLTGSNEKKRAPSCKSTTMTFFASIPREKENAGEMSITFWTMKWALGRRPLTCVARRDDGKRPCACLVP